MYRYMADKHTSGTEELFECEDLDDGDILV